jgi:uncharacterized membrane protein
MKPYYNITETMIFGFQNNKTMKKDKKFILLIVSIIALIIFIATSLIFSFHLNTENKLVSPLFTPFVKYNAQFIIILVSLSIFVGGAIFYLMLGKIEKTKEIVKTDINIMLKLLNKDEGLIIEKLINSKGKVLQSEISRAEGLNKVKAHRILSRLRERGVIRLEKYGKTNLVYLSKDILGSL